MGSGSFSHLPHPPRLAAGPFFPYLFPASSPGFLRGRCPSHLPAGPYFPRLRLLPDSATAKWQSPSRGRQGAGRPPSFLHVFPCGVPSDPLWNVFLPARSLRFQLTIPSAHPTLFTHGPALPLSSSCSPYPFLPQILSLLFYLSSFSRHPFSGLGLLSPLFPTSIPVTPLCTPPSSPISFQNRSHRPLLHNPQSLTPSVHTLIQALRRQPLSSRVPTRVLLHASLLSASASCGSLRPPRPPARPFPSFLLPLMSP